MKLHEAIVELRKPENKFMWMRPVKWKGCRQAYCLGLDGLDTEIVPGSQGGRCHMTSGITSLTSDWEVVSPDTVLDGG